MKLLKYICLIISALFILAGIAPFFYNIFHIGSGLLIILALIIAALPFLLKAFKDKKIAKNITIAMYSVLFLSIGIIFTSMLKQAYFTKPPDTGKVTVIALGARVVGDQPSYMLRNRLIVARNYLQENPEAVVIVSGGQGADEQYPEGLVMSNFLIKHGIDGSRIIIEDKSTNTYENLKFSKPLIPEDSRGIVIISDDFHQKRASMLAKSLGLDPIYSESSIAPPALIPMYWARDMAGVVYVWFTNIL